MSFSSTKTNLLLASLLTSLAITGCNSESNNSSNDSTNSTVNQNSSNQNGTSNSGSNQTGGNSGGNTGGSAINQANLKEQLKKNEWKLLEAKDSNNSNINVLTNLNKKNTKLRFKANGGISFEVGCNTYSGQYALSASNELSTTGMRATEMFCANLDAAEKELAKLLKQKSQLILSKNGTKNIITMTMADGSKLVWEPRITTAYIKGSAEIASNLRKYNWVLKSASKTPEALEKSSLDRITELEAIKDKVKLTINGNRLGYTTGCYQQSTKFTISGDAKLSLSDVTTNMMDCYSSTSSASNILDQIMQQDTKVTMLMAETPIFTQETISSGNEPIKYLTWQAVDKSQMDLLSSINQYNWKLTNALRSNSPTDSSVSTVPELIAVKDNVSLTFNFVSADLSNMRNHVSYSAGCNKYKIDFKVDQNDVLSYISNVNKTEKACSTDTASAETELNTIMKKGGKLVITVDNNQPTLTYSTGNTTGSIETLIWQGTVR